MNFEEALTEIKNGKQVYRKQWPGGYLARAYCGDVPDVWMRTIGGVKFVWTPHSIDLFAEDWEVYAQQEVPKAKKRLADGR